jgi:hypothetical protein
MPHTVTTPYFYWRNKKPDLTTAVEQIITSPTGNKEDGKLEKGNTDKDEKRG